MKTTNKGALVEAVATDAPAATKLDAGDVIVAARGKPIRTPGQLRAVVHAASIPATTSCSASGATASSRR